MLASGFPRPGPARSLTFSGCYATAVFVLQPETLLADWEALDWPFHAPPRLLRGLPGGLTNRSYLIEADAERWVLRIDTPHSAVLGIDRLREHTLLRHAAGAGLAPALVCADAEHGYLISAYVDGQHLKPAALAGHQRTALFELFERVHALPGDGAPVDYLRSDSATDSRAVAELLIQLRADIDSLAAQCAASVCHHDPVPGNVIFSDSRLYLIDWEYAGRGLPVVDWAALACEWQLPLAAISEVSGFTEPLLLQAERSYRTLCRVWQERIASRS